MAHQEQVMHTHHHRHFSPASSDLPRTAISRHASPFSAPAAAASRSSSFVPAAPLFPSHAAAAARSSAARKSRSDISEAEKQDIRMAFELFDARKTGKLSYRELKVAMRTFDFDVKKAEVKKLMEEHSRGNTEEVDLAEFMDIMTVKYKEKDPDEELAKAFRYFDEDGSGKITLTRMEMEKLARPNLWQL
ncbi:hypothetical protein O6H91_19G058700 [Diphasiastrum complanatum]|uniref:Uncharacterized protein n=1 Tax=Diphasiastrum complanatum TaxID=34168 RepID=A0ACC2AVI8_DIPCM|nr:hypothetical protein O6H91_19G058700 [Diphasiastrum complanatum]